MWDPFSTVGREHLQKVISEATCLKCHHQIFFFFWLLWVFVAVCGLSLVAASGRYSPLRYGGFSCGARALGVWASVVAACGLNSCSSRGLELRLSSCGAWA